MGCLKRSKLWTEWDLQVLRVQKERSGKHLCFSLHYGTEEPLVLCFLLTHRWHRHYRFVKCKELFNWLGNSWIWCYYFCALIFCPYFFPVVTLPQRPHEKGLDPRSRAAACQLHSASPRLSGRVCMCSGEGSDVGELDRNSVWKETSGNGYLRALADQGQQGFRTGKHCCLAHLGTGNQKGGVARVKYRRGW